jgi:hypothetical protein
MEARDTTSARSSSTFSAPAPAEHNEPQPVRTPSGFVVDRPDLAYRERVAAAEGKTLPPLPEGTLFTFSPADGAQGGTLAISVDREGAISFAIVPDKGLQVAVRIAGADAERFRRAVV